MILCSFSCICRLSWACIFCKTSTKATRNANASLTVFPHCLLQLSVLPLDCYLFCSPLLTAPSGFLCQLPFCPFWDLHLLVHFQSCGRSRAQTLCLDFAPKQTKRLLARRTHSHSVTHGVTRKIVRHYSIGVYTV